MAKITKQEFENWSEVAKKILAQISLNPSIDSDPEENKKFTKMAGLIKSEIEEENYFAVYVFLSGLDRIDELGADDEAKVKQKFQELGTTLNEWEEQVWKRLKEQCETDGYYKPVRAFNFSEWVKKRDELKELVKGNYFSELSPFMKDNFRILFGVKHFLEESDKIYPDSEEDRDKKMNEKGKKFAERYRFIVEDIWGRLQEAKQRKEQAERERERQFLPSHYP
jgi:hypothetical protein